MTQPTQTTKYIKPKRISCIECKSKGRYPSDENPQICQHCYKAKKLELSGNKIIDDFIRYTNVHNTSGKKMSFVPYDKFQNIEFIAE